MLAGMEFRSGENISQFSVVGGTFESLSVMILQTLLVTRSCESFRQAYVTARMVRCNIESSSKRGYRLIASAEILKCSPLSNMCLRIFFRVVNGQIGKTKSLSFELQG